MIIGGRRPADVGFFVHRRKKNRLRRFSTGVVYEEGSFNFPARFVFLIPSFFFIERQPSSLERSTRRQYAIYIQEMYYIIFFLLLARVRGPPTKKTMRRCPPPRAGRGGYGKTYVRPKKLYRYFSPKEFLSGGHGTTFLPRSAFFFPSRHTPPSPPRERTDPEPILLSPAPPPPARRRRKNEKGE